MVFGYTKYFILTYKLNNLPQCLRLRCNVASGKDKL